MRQRYWVIPIVGLAWWLWSYEAKPLDLVAGTTHDSFAILDRDTGRLTEVTSTNQPVRELTVPITKDTRVVGTNRGTAIVYQDGRRVALALVDRPDHEELFGKRVEKLCSQAATTHLMFGIGWLERDGSLWVLRGSSYDANHETAVEAIAATEEPETASPYCGVTDADNAVALLYQSGNRLELLRCEEGKRCGQPRRVDVPKSDTVLGFGCTMRYCLIATRPRSKDTRPSLYWVDAKAGKVDGMTLMDATQDGSVTIAGEGDRFALGYTNAKGAAVAFSETPGSVRRIWNEGDTGTVPVLSWMGNVLLIAGQRDGKLVTATTVL